MEKQEIPRTMVRAVSNKEAMEVEELVEAFGSEFSVQDNASAHIKANSNKNAAGEILHGPSSVDKCIKSTEPATFSCTEDTARESKSKRTLLLTGTVSGVIGTGYTKSGPVKSYSGETKKPLKLECKDFPALATWGENNQEVFKDMKDDVEKFLFRMLGTGFQLDISIIQNVLGICGYDISESMDKLLDLSASTLEKSDDVIGITNQVKETSPDHTFFPAKEQVEKLRISAQSERVKAVTRTDWARTTKDKAAVEKEIFESLFTLPSGPEQPSKRKHVDRPTLRSKAYGELVTAPYEDIVVDTPPVAEVQVLTKEGMVNDNGISYEALRESVNQYWILMKEHYKAAVETFAAGDHEKAHELLKLGQHFHKKAREADQESCQKLFKPRDDEIIKYDLWSLEPKHALQFLRLHLTTLSGIPTIKYLRLVIEKDDEDTRDGQKRMKLITKQLEKESIEWIEEGKRKTMLIQVDQLDPRSFSFAKKK